MWVQWMFACSNLWMVFNLNICSFGYRYGMCPLYKNNHSSCDNQEAELYVRMGGAYLHQLPDSAGISPRWSFHWRQRREAECMISYPYSKPQHHETPVTSWPLNDLRQREREGVSDFRSMTETCFLFVLMLMFFTHVCGPVNSSSVLLIKSVDVCTSGYKQLNHLQ